jgi:ABC-type transporter Mla subunit MlaD
MEIDSEPTETKRARPSVAAESPSVNALTDGIRDLSALVNKLLTAPSKATGDVHSIVSSVDKLVGAVAQKDVVVGGLTTEVTGLMRIIQERDRDHASRIEELTRTITEQNKFNSSLLSTLNGLTTRFGNSDGVTRRRCYGQFSGYRCCSDRRAYN